LGSRFESRAIARGGRDAKRRELIGTEAMQKKTYSSSRCNIQKLVSNYCYRHDFISSPIVFLVPVLPAKWCALQLPNEVCAELFGKSLTESFGLIRSLPPVSEGKYRICARMLVFEFVGKPLPPAGWDSERRGMNKPNKGSAWKDLGAAVRLGKFVLT